MSQLFGGLQGQLGQLQSQFQQPLGPAPEQPETVVAKLISLHNRLVCMTETLDTCLAGLRGSNKPPAQPTPSTGTTPSINDMLNYLQEEATRLAERGNELLTHLRP